MVDRQNLFFRCLAPCAVLVALAGAVPVASAAAPESDFELLLAEADGHAIDGRYAQALDAYEHAYEAMPAELIATGVGELVVLAGGKAAVEDYKVRGEIESLKRGRALLVKFVTAVSADPNAAPPSLNAVQAWLDEIDEAIPAPEPVEPLHSSPVETPASEPKQLDGTNAPEITHTEEEEDRGPHIGPLGYTGIGVGVLGTGALAAGIPLIFRPPDMLRGEPPNVEEYSTAIPGIVMAVGGGVALAAGVTLVVVDLVRRRKQHMAILPAVDRQFVGASLSTKF
jgi:hypothetical protein